MTPNNLSFIDVVTLSSEAVTTLQELGYQRMNNDLDIVWTIDEHTDTEDFVRQLIHVMSTAWGFMRQHTSPDGVSDADITYIRDGEIEYSQSLMYGLDKHMTP